MWLAADTCGRIWFPCLTVGQFILDLLWGAPQGHKNHIDPDLPNLHLANLPCSVPESSSLWGHNPFINYRLYWDLYWSLYAFATVGTWVWSPQAQ